MMSNGSWHSDPYGRHQLRWWDGAQWTTQVSDNGVTLDEATMPHVEPLPPPHLEAAPPVTGASVPPPPPATPVATVGADAPKPNRTRIFAALGAVAVIIVAVVVVVATRGGSNSSSRSSQTDEGKKYVAAMIASNNSNQFTSTETKCIAEGAIDIIGVQTLKDAGVTPENMTSKGSSDLLPGFKPTETQANSIVDLMFRCVDFGKAFAEQMTGTSVSIPAEKMHCVGDAMSTNKTFRAYLVKSMLNSDTTTTDPQGEKDLQTEMLGMFTKCGISLTDLAG